MVNQTSRNKSQNPDKGELKSQLTQEVEEYAAIINQSYKR